MSNINFDEMGPLLTREASARRQTLLGIFVLVSLMFLVLGFFWDKKFSSYVQLYVDDSQIVAPIVGAEVSQSRDQANVAREELFTAEILDTIIDSIPYYESDVSKADRERLKQDIVEDTEIYNINNQLLEIAFQHRNPRVAFETTSLFADLFLEKSMESSTAETTEAFEFIIDQVETYRSKLEDAESKLEAFRAQYPGISSTTEGNVDQQIVELRRDLERTRLQYAQAEQRRRSLERELSSESSTIAQDYEAARIADRVAGLQRQIDDLRLNYTDDYPDIVRLRQEINALRQMGAAPVTSGGTRSINLGGNVYSAASNASPVYQQLRSDLARSAAEADTLRVTVQELEVMLNSEIDRSSISSRVERELTELTRDYTINKELYEDLLRRQESARLSMSLGAEKQGVLYRIAQPANFPYLPTGLRFMHIAAGGIVLASVLPFLYLFAFLKLDPRIRTGSAVTDVLELPLLTTIPHMDQRKDKVGFFGRPLVMVATVATVCALYVVVFIVKNQLEAASAVGSLL